MEQSTASINKKYEKLMDDIGGFGKFQKRLCFLMALSSVPNGYFAMAMVFVGRTPPSYRCFVPGVDDDFDDTESFTTPGATTEPVATTTNEVRHTTAGEFKQEDECKLPGRFTSNSTNGTSGCPYGIVYGGFEEGRTSIVTEWDLVCDRDWIMPLIMSTYMAGVLVGSVVSGAASDRFGRYPTFLFGTLIMFLFLGLCGVAPSPAAFAAILFVAGALAFMNYVTAFIIAAEIINAKDRVVTGTLAVGGFAIGYMLLPAFAFFVKDWRILCFVLASLGVLYIPYIWLVDESPRWLFSKGRKKKFIKLVLKIAKTNGVGDEKTKELVAEFYKDAEEEAFLPSHDKLENTSQDTVSTATQYSYLDLLRIDVVRSRTLCMWFTWFVCSVVYFGVAFNTSNMGGNPYINCFVAAAVEIPAYAMVIGLLKWRGRKPVLISTLLVAGLACSSVPYLKYIHEYLAIAFAMIGKLAVSSSFSIVYIVCSELYPTLMRSMGIGSSSMAARVGGMIAPHLLFLGHSYENAPFLVMGILAFVAAACNRILPETGGQALPETTSDLKPIICIHCFQRYKIKEKKNPASPC